MDSTKKNLFFVLVITIGLLLTSMIVFAQECAHKNHKGEQHYTCIHFVNEYDGKEVRNSCAPQGTSGSKAYTHNKTKETNGGDIYTISGWYDAEGNNVSDSSNPAKIKVSYKASTEKCDDIYYYLKWNVEKAPRLFFNYTDKVSTGSGSWANTNGNTSSYSHTFKQPEDQPHFSFLYWAIGNDIYNDGDKFSYSFKDKEVNTKETIDAYAWWQSSVTLNLYDEDTLLSSEEDFEEVSINVNPTKKGYKFTGWVDEEGNKVTTDTFYPLESSIEKVEPRVINLYATWEKEEQEHKTTPKDNTDVKGATKESKETVLPPKTGI